MSGIWKLTAIAIVAIISVGAVSFVLSDASEASDDSDDWGFIKDAESGLMYETFKDTATVVDCSIYATEVTVPETITDDEGNVYTVNRIANDAFKNCTKLKSLSVPYMNLTAPVDRCKSLETIYVPMIESGNTVFRYLPESLRSIDVGPDNPNFTTIDGILYDKDVKTLVRVPRGFTGDYFAPDTVRTVDYSAFSNVSGLVSISLPHVDNIRGSVSSNCTSLVSVYAPEAKSLSFQAFFRCPSLERVDISNVESMMHNPFSSCPNINEVIISPENRYYTVYEGAIYDKGMTTIVSFFLSGAESMVLPDSVTAVGGSAFESSRIGSLTMPSVISIDSIAFMYGTFDRVSAPSATEFKDNAFHQSNIRVLDLGSAKALDMSVPAGLEILNIPFAESINPYYLGNIGSLPSIYVNPSNRSYATVDGILYDKGMTELLTYPSERSDASFEVPSTVKSIASGAFRNNTHLVSLSMPSVVSIDSIAGLPALESLYMPSIERIGGAIGYCPSLTTIDIGEDNPNYVMIDGILYDRGVTELIHLSQSVTGTFEAPATVTKVRGSAMGGCSITHLYLPSVTLLDSSILGGIKGLEYLYVPSLFDWSHFAFDECTSLTSIDVGPDNADYVTVDGVLYSKDMTELALVPPGTSGAFTIPDTVTEIWSDSFAFSGVTSVKFPASIEHISSTPFRGCQDLKVIDMSETGSMYYGMSLFTGLPSLSEVRFGSEAAYYDNFSTDFYTDDGFRIFDIDPLNNKTFVMKDGFFFEKRDDGNSIYVVIGLVAVLVLAMVALVAVRRTR